MDDAADAHTCPALNGAHFGGNRGGAQLVNTVSDGVISKVTCDFKSDKGDHVIATTRALRLSKPLPSYHLGFCVITVARVAGNVGDIGIVDNEPKPEL